MAFFRSYDYSSSYIKNKYAVGDEMTITGKTKLYFVLADPIDQVRAPEVFNYVFTANGIDAVLVPLHVTAADLNATIRSLFLSKNTGGLLLSIPHKQASVNSVDHCSANAGIAGAINAIRRNAAGKLEGDLFDGLSFLSALEYADIAFENQRALLIGAGGAASAIASALAAANVNAISIYDPCDEKSHRLASQLRQTFNIDVAAVSSNDPQGHTLIINASPLGLEAGDQLPVDVGRIDANAAVYDVLMKNQPTPFLQAVRARGIVAEPGFEMLIQQTPLYLDFFGHSDAAAIVRKDASAIRSLLYPNGMAF